jgi:hypothetical protein
MAAPIDDIAFVKAREEQQILSPYSDLLHENNPVAQLRECMLYRTVEDPASIASFLLCESQAPTGEPRLEGMLRFVHDQCHPVVPNRVFNALVKCVAGLEAEHPCRDAVLFWTLLILMDIEEAVFNAVNSTWKGSERMWSVAIWPYLRNRIDELLQAPIDPENADICINTLWRVTRVDLLAFNVRAMLLEGVLRPISVPISRNALRLRKKDMIEQRDQAQKLRQQEQNLALISGTVAHAESHE